MSFNIDLPDNWQWTTIQEVQALEKRATVTGPFGSSIGKKFFVDRGIPVIRGNNLNFSQSTFNDSGFVFITPEKAEELKGYKAIAGDLIFTAAGTIGQVALIPENANYSTYIISNKQMRARFDPEKVNKVFAYYWFSSPSMTAHIKRQDTGSTIPLINLSVLRALPLPLPPLSEQDGISRVLKSLDDKIELNTQTNQTLEQLAQAIFKSWFVDFDPVKAKIASLEAGGTEEDALIAAMQVISGKNEDELAKMQQVAPEKYDELRETASLFPSAMQDSELGEIPQGWMAASFAEIARLDTSSVKPGNSPDKQWEHYSIPAFDDGKSPALELGAEIKSNKYKVHPAAVLSSKLNPHFPRTWWPDVAEAGAAICSTEFMQFVPKVPAHRPFVAGMVTSQPFQIGIMMRVTGSTGSRQRAQPKQVAEMEVVLPTVELVVKFSKLAEPLYQAQARNIKQSQGLAHLRDTLLPKLLSGELSVADIESEVEA